MTDEDQSLTPDEEVLTRVGRKLAVVLTRTIEYGIQQRYPTANLVDRVYAEYPSDLFLQIKVAIPFLMLRWHGQILEDCLKAFLLMEGVPADQLRSEGGHNLPKLLASLKEKSSTTHRWLVRRLSEPGSVFPVVRDGTEMGLGGYLRLLEKEHWYGRLHDIVENDLADEYNIYGVDQYATFELIHGAMFRACLEQREKFAQAMPRGSSGTFMGKPMLLSEDSEKFKELSARYKGLVMKS